MSFAAGPSPADDTPHTPDLSSLYCPGCDVERDPLHEVLTIHWCDEHRPSSGGVDDTRSTLGRAGLTAMVDAEAETNRLWCDLFHRVLNQRSGARTA
jgi:hypothetical protein